METSAGVNQAVSPGDVEELFQLLLDRGVNNDVYKKAIVDRQMTIGDLVKDLRTSAELRMKISRESGFSYHPDRIKDAEFRVPRVLSRPDTKARKIILIGSCLMVSWPLVLEQHDPKLSVERIVFNNASPLPPMSKEQLAGFDFQLVQLPLRSVLPEGLFYGLKYGDEAAYAEAFDVAAERLRQNATAALSYNAEAGIRSFVLNLAVPQQNPVGRLQPRYSLGNLVYFVEELNRVLHATVAEYRDAHVIDFDQIIATFGKKYFQDDVTSHSNHGSLLGAMEMSGDEARLEPLGDVHASYGGQTARVIVSLYEEALAADRSIRQTDSVKLVVFDLDDTLWRGVIAEQDEIGIHNIEGWPLAMVEVVANLWRRGVLVAVASKNDEERTRAAWRKLYGQLFPIENFVSMKIGWEPKVESIRQILAEVNLLPGNVVFVDDNPVERAQVAQDFPEMRVLDAKLIEWRRILLWSAETQPGAMTAEGIARTEMIQAQIKRDSTAATMDKAAFLASLNVTIVARRILSTAHPQFARALELLNKTNQFNTTGFRWEPAALADLFEAGGMIVTATVSDRFTDYGCVALAVVTGETIEQIVMSCRVFGMEVEKAIVSLATAEVARVGKSVARARLQDSGKNKLALPLYEAAGFKNEGGFWCRQAGTMLDLPAHITLIDERG